MSLCIETERLYLRILKKSDAKELTSLANDKFIAIWTTVPHPYTFKGAYDFIKKPFEYEDLTKTIKNALNQKILKEENTIINQKLRLSEERYRNLVQNSPDIIYTLDKNGNFTFLNSAAENLLGLKNEQFIGEHY